MSDLDRELKVLLRDYYQYMRHCELAGDSKDSHTTVRTAIKDANQLRDTMAAKIKQAFVDAGWEPVLVLNREQSFMATGDKIYRTATLRTEDEWKARNEGKLMTSQEWLGEFIDEFMEEFKGRKYITPEGSIVDYELEKDIRKWVAAKRASGVEDE